MMLPVTGKYEQEKLNEILILVHTLVQAWDMILYQITPGNLNFLNFDNYTSLYS